MNFGKILKNLRNEKELTQLQVAKSIGYSKAIIGFWENGKKSPNLEALQKIADYFNVSIDYLAGRENEAGIKINHINNSFNNNSGKINFRG